MSTVLKEHCDCAEACECHYCQSDGPHCLSEESRSSIAPELREAVERLRVTAASVARRIHPLGYHDEADGLSAAAAEVKRLLEKA